MLKERSGWWCMIECVARRRGKRRVALAHGAYACHQVGDGAGRSSRTVGLFLDLFASVIIPHLRRPLQWRPYHPYLRQYISASSPARPRK